MPVFDILPAPGRGLQLDGNVLPRECSLRRLRRGHERFRTHNKSSLLFASCNTLLYLNGYIWMSRVIGDKFIIKLSIAVIHLINNELMH